MCQLQPLWDLEKSQRRGKGQASAVYLIQYPHAVLDPDWTRRENTEAGLQHIITISPSVHPSGSETCCQLRCVAERAGTLATSSNPICPVLLTFTPCEQNTIDMPTINTIIMPKSGHSLPPHRILLPPRSAPGWCSRGRSHVHLQRKNLA